MEKQWHARRQNNPGRQKIRRQKTPISTVPPSTVQKCNKNWGSSSVENVPLYHLKIRCVFVNNVFNKFGRVVRIRIVACEIAMVEGKKASVSLAVW